MKLQQLQEAQYVGGKDDSNERFEHWLKYMQGALGDSLWNYKGSVDNWAQSVEHHMSKQEWNVTGLRGWSHELNELKKEIPPEEKRRYVDAFKELVAKLKG